MAKLKSQVGDNRPSKDLAQLGRGTSIPTKRLRLRGLWF